MFKLVHLEYHCTYTRRHRLQYTISKYNKGVHMKAARMHSSGMHTAHLLTVSQHALCRGVYPSMHWAGRCLRGVSPRGVSAQGEGVCVCLWTRRGVGCIPACNWADTSPSLCIFLHLFFLMFSVPMWPPPGPAQACLQGDPTLPLPWVWPHPIWTCSNLFIFDPPRTCSNLFILDLTVHTPQTCSNLFVLDLTVHTPWTCSNLFILDLTVHTPWTCSNLFILDLTVHTTWTCSNLFILDLTVHTPWTCSNLFILDLTVQTPWTCSNLFILDLTVHTAWTCSNLFILDLTVQTPWTCSNLFILDLTVHTPQTCSNLFILDLTVHTPWTCSNLFILDLTVQTPWTCSNLFILDLTVQIPAPSGHVQTMKSWLSAVGIRLKCLLIFCSNRTGYSSLRWQRGQHTGHRRQHSRHFHLQRWVSVYTERQGSFILYLY